MSERRQSRSPNRQVYWRANQFPSARTGGPIVSGVTQQNAESETDELPEPEKSKLEYLRNRFRPTDTSGVDGSQGPCGQ